MDWTPHPRPHRFSKWLLIKDQALAYKQFGVTLLLSITTIKFYLRTVALATVVFQHVCHLGFQKIFILRKTAANFIEISRKHVFAASNRNIITVRVYKKKLEQILSKSYSFLFQTLICIIRYASIVSDDVIQLTSKYALIIGLQVLKVLI